MRDTTTHIAQVIGTNAAAWTVALTNINGLLTSLSLVLASSYTLYKFYKEIKKKEKE